jgi:hypothetical protein
MLGQIAPLQHDRPLLENALMVRILKLLIVGAVASVSLVVLSTPASAEVRRTVGGVDFASYCHKKYSRSISATYGKAELFSRDVRGWRCVVHQWNGSVSGIPLGWALVGIYDIDVDAACRQQYGRQSARASFRGSGDPYSWYCWYPVSYLA